MKNIFNVHDLKLLYISPLGQCFNKFFVKYYQYAGYCKNTSILQNEKLKYFNVVALLCCQFMM